MVAQKLHVRPWREVAELYRAKNPGERMSRSRAEQVCKRAMEKMARRLRKIGEELGMSG